jgi:hypothetical protein
LLAFNECDQVNELCAGAPVAVRRMANERRVYFIAVPWFVLSMQKRYSC